jgi:HEAT repeat protein
MNNFLRWIVVLVALGAAVWTRSDAEEIDAAPAAGDERLLESAGLSAEGPGLLEFFRARAHSEPEPGRVEELVRRITSLTYEERIQAGAELVALGPLAIAGLRRVANDLEDPEVRELARRCLTWVEGPQSASLSIAAARLLARRKPAGAAEALLAYLPYADNEDVVREVSGALQTVAVTGGRPHPALLRALSDAMPLRRAIAGAALSQAAPPENQAVEKLLHDANPEVRMTAALSLAKAHNAGAIPVLIDLIAVLPAKKRTHVEDYLQELAGEWAPGGGPASEDEIARRIRRDAWASWWANTDGPALISLLGKHTLTAQEEEKVKDGIRRLGHKTYVVREKAVAELVGRGRRILPLLREALKNNELEIVRRAQRCIERIEAEPSNRLPAAALRLLALRKPPGAAEALLAYLPFAEEDYLDDIKSSMAVLALRDGKPDPALLRALSSSHPGVRGAAAEALAEIGGPDAKPAIAKLLADTDLTVRLRTALALAPHDGKAVPVLIDLIANLSDEQAAQVHEFLVPLAGDKAPPAPQDSAESRKASSAAWAAWWKENAPPRTDLGKLARRYQQLLGYTVLCEHNTGKITELGRDHKPRWSFSGVQSPVDAWVLPNNRVLVAEYGGNRVSCRDLKGNVLWLKQLNCNPHNVQPLPNGNVFIAGNNQIFEVDRNGKDVALPIKDVNTLLATVGQFTGAYKARNGQITIVGQNNGRCVRLDSSGKELHSFITNRGNAWLDVTPNGRIIMASNGGNKIAEYNGQGKLVVELDVQQVSMVTGLPSGNFLVASHNAGRVFEMDRRGKTLWEYHTQGPFRARGR